MRVREKESEKEQNKKEQKKKTHTPTRSSQHFVNSNNKEIDKQQKRSKATEEPFQESRCDLPYTTLCHPAAPPENRRRDGSYARVENESDARSGVLAGLHSCEAKEHNHKSTHGGAEHGQPRREEQHATTTITLLDLRRRDEVEQQQTDGREDDRDADDKRKVVLLALLLVCGNNAVDEDHK